MSLRDLYARKWSRRSKALAVVALACGFLTFRIVDGYAGELDTLRPLAGSLVPVVVASGDLARGAAIAEGDVQLEQIPNAYAPPGAVRVLSDAVGQTLVSDVASGEAITATRISVAGGPVASLVPSGLRAFPIAATVPLGSIGAGDRVDVIATYGGPHPYSDTVATGLEVLSVGGASEDGALVATADGTTSLLLLVTSETAEQLAYASAYADLAVSIDSTKGDGL